MILGFTGSSKQSMTSHQVARFALLLNRLQPEEFRHGDCIKRDAEAHALVRRLVPNCRIVIHPPVDPKKRAFCKGDLILVPQPYLVRNRAIVLKVDEMVAMPRTFEPEKRSGTWYTIRRAREAGKMKHLIWPEEKQHG